MFALHGGREGDDDEQRREATGEHTADETSISIETVPNVATSRDSEKD